MIRYLLFWAAIPAWCAAAPAPENPLGPLIQNLGNEHYRVREDATHRLLEVGQKQRTQVQAACLRAFLHADDPEIRMRCRSILMHLVVGEPGFLGVSGISQKVYDPEGKSRVGYKITLIAPDSAAQSVGLRLGDVVLQVQGQYLDEKTPSEHLNCLIKQHQADEIVTLSILRNGDLLRLAPRLTKRTGNASISHAEREQIFLTWLKQNGG